MGAKSISEILDKAEEYTGQIENMLYEPKSEMYYRNIRELIEANQSIADELPKWAFYTSAEYPTLDCDTAIEDMLERHGECLEDPVEECFLKGVDELEKAIDRFNEANVGNKQVAVYMPDYSKKIRVSREAYEPRPI